MLPKPNRLPPHIFDHVFKAGKRVNHPLFQCVISPNNTPLSRFAFVVGTKIDKHAVGRNRMKRLLREAVWHLLPNIKPGTDCILVARKKFSDIKETEIEQILREIFNHSHLFIDEKTTG